MSFNSYLENGSENCRSTEKIHEKLQIVISKMWIRKKSQTFFLFKTKTSYFDMRVLMCKYFKRFFNNLNVNTTIKKVKAGYVHKLNNLQLIFKRDLIR